MSQSVQRWARAAGALALLGGTLGVAMDALHVASGTTSYAEPWIFGIATWTIPLFASAGVVLGLVPAAIDQSLAVRGLIGPAHPPRAPASLVAMALFVSAYAISCVVHGAAAVVVLTAVAMLAWWIADRRPIGIAHALAAAVAGPCVEIALVSAGAFAHRDTELLGVAVWLPCLYLSASVATASLARLLVSSAPLGADPARALR